MDWSGWSVPLTWAGGAFEVVGVLLIVREIWQDRRLARDLFSTTLDIHSARHEHTADAVVLGVEPQREPTTAERVTILERAMASLRESFETNAQATKIEMHDAIQRAAEELSDKDKERDEALRQFIHDQLTGGIAWRIAGVGFVLVGIICSTVGGVL